MSHNSRGKKPSRPVASPAIVIGVPQKKHAPWHKNWYKNAIIQMMVTLALMTSVVQAQQPVASANQQAMLSKPLPTNSAPASEPESYSAPASAAPNPLMRPSLSKVKARATSATPSPSAPPAESGQSSLASSVGSALNAPSSASTSTSTQTTPALPRFDGWYVSVLTSEVAVLRAPDKASGDTPAAKPGSAGFGTAGTESASSNQVSIGQELEVENGGSFTFNEVTLRAKIQNGLVTLTLVGANKYTSPVTVFAGRLGSRPISTAIVLEKANDRYVTSVKPATNTAKSAQSGSGGGSGMTGTASTGSP